MSEENTIGLIIGAVLMFWFLHPAEDIQETTVYYSYCPDFKHNSYSCPKNLEVMKTRYKIFLKEQTVVSEGVQNMLPCQVFDKDNWQCHVSGNTTNVRDGRYSEANDIDAKSLDEKDHEVNLPRYIQISGFEYKVRSFLKWFR